MLARAVAFSTRAPVTVLLVALALTLLAGGHTALNLGINTSTMDMISSDVPFRQHAREFRRTFPAFDEPIVAVVDAATPEQADRAAERLAKTLRADEARFAAVEYTAGNPFFVRHGLLYQDVEALADLTDRLAAAQPMIAALAEDPTLRGIASFVDLAVQGGGAEEGLPAELEQLFDAMASVVRAQIAGEPMALSWRSLMAAEEDGVSTRRLVLAQPRFETNTLAPAGEAIAALRAAIADHGLAGDDVQIRLTGEAVLDAEELRSVSSGALLGGALTTVAVTILLVLGLRSLRLIVATLGTLAVGLVLTAGFATLAVGRLNLISVAFAVLFVGLGVDFGIHFALRYREAFLRGAPVDPALSTAAGGVGGALSLSALCAALAFLSFAPTDYLGLAELGIIAAGGMGIAWLSSFTLLPALLHVMPLRRRIETKLGPDAGTVPRPRSRRVDQAIVAVALIAAIGSLVALPRVEFDFDPLHLKDPGTESVSTLLDLAQDDSIAPYSIDVLAENFESAVLLAGRLRELDRVGRVVTLASFVPANQDEKLELLDVLAFSLGPVLETGADATSLEPEARRAAFERLRSALGAADDPAAAELMNALDRLAEGPGPSDAALVELEDRLVRFLPDLLAQLRTMLTAGPVSVDDLPPEVVARWIADDGRARVLVQPSERIESNTELRTFARSVSEVAPAATGMPVVVTEAGGAVLAAFREASVYAFVMIAVVLALALRSLRDILLVLVPLALAMLYTAASTVILDLPFNFANVIVLPLLLGLGVSGAIHVVLRERQGEQGDLFATSTPRAVLFSALTTIASFGSLAVSNHRGLSSMGLLLTIAILWSLVATLVVLPAMLALRNGGLRRKPGPSG